MGELISQVRSIPGKYCRRRRLGVQTSLPPASRLARDHASLPAPRHPRPRPRPRPANRPGNETHAGPLAPVQRSPAAACREHAAPHETRARGRATPLRPLRPPPGFPRRRRRPRLPCARANPGPRPDWPPHSRFLARTAILKILLILRKGERGASVTPDSVPRALSSTLAAASQSALVPTRARPAAAATLGEGCIGAGGREGAVGPARPPRPFGQRPGAGEGTRRGRGAGVGVGGAARSAVPAAGVPGPRGGVGGTFQGRGHRRPGSRRGQL